MSNTLQHNVYLTRQQQKVLIVAMFLLLVGLAVKVWRTASTEPQMSGQTTY